MFTVLFERLACRIVLEKPLGQLEFLEPNRLISLVVSMHSSCQYPIILVYVKLTIHIVLY